jgi:hypothetical protein
LILTQQKQWQRICWLVCEVSSNFTFLFFPLNEICETGALARCGAACIMFPIDVVKTRMQFQTNSMSKQQIIRKYYTSGFNAFVSIVKEEGLRGLYRGLTVRLLYIAPAAAVSFTVYESFTQALHNRHSESFQWKTPVITLAAGALARVVGTACRTPFDILKQQLQVEGQLNPVGPATKPLRDLGLIKSIKHIVQSNGLKGFFSGYGVTLLRDAPFAAIYFTTYDTMKTYVFKARPINPDGTVKPLEYSKDLISGAIAGCVSTCCTIPADVVKTRLQTQSKLGKDYYHGIKDAFVKIYREEGLKAFTNGLGPRLAYIMPASGLTFTLYEILKGILKYSYTGESTSSGN